MTIHLHFHLKHIWTHSNTCKGYGADEIAKMIDKKDLINALSYEEHRTEQKEKERKKRVALRRSIIVALICVIVVMFKPLFVHAWEVICVNVEVYTDKKKYEFSRIVEFRSPKAAFGLLLTIGVNCLQFWLSASVLLSWVMKSEYFFPIPHIPIRPAALLATATGNTGGAGPLGSYGINVGPMVVSWLFRFTNGKIENFMGRALADAHKKQKKKMKAARKEQEKKEAAIAKEERRAARRARRAEREARKKEAEARGETYEPPKKPESERSQPTSATTVPEVKPTPVQNTTKDFEREKHHVAAGAMDELD